MPFFLHQATYTTEAWTRLMANPQDRHEAVRGPIEKLGGRLHNFYYAFGDHDVVAITEFPDNVSAAAISIAFAAGGAVRNAKTTPLMTATEAVEALKRAGSSGYRSFTTGAAAAGR